MPTQTTNLFLLELPAVQVARAVSLREQGVISDWKFFLDKEDWLNFWARRFGESAVHHLADELRRLPWRVARDQPDQSNRQTAVGGKNE